MEFRKSSFSSTEYCVEVAQQKWRIDVRDSKDQNGPVLSFNREEWDAFIKGVKAGEFDVSF